VTIRGTGRGGIWICALLGVVASLAQFGKALVVASQWVAPVLGLLSGLIGVIGLIGVALSQTRPRAAALILATAGLAAITVDGLGLPPPRMLPGAALILAAGAALATRPVDRGTTPVAFTWGRLAAWIGLGLHLMVAVPLLAIGLVVPGWAVTALWTAWSALFFLALHVRRTRPWLVPVIAPATAALLVGALLLGERLLGWTA
jgi:hypothetical protein